GPEAPVEVAAPLGRADDGVQPNRLTPQPPLATPARGADDLIQRHEPVGVAAPNAQPVPQRGQELPTPGPKKVILDVHLKESGSPHLIPPSPPSAARLAILAVRPGAPDRPKAISVCQRPALAAGSGLRHSGLGRRTSHREGQGRAAPGTSEMFL